MSVRIPARHVTVLIHVPIDPPVLVTEHPCLADAGPDPFMAETAVWSSPSEVTIHSARATRCLHYNSPDIPEWVPKPPLGWDAKLREFESWMMR